MVIAITVAIAWGALNAHVSALEERVNYMDSRGTTAYQSGIAKIQAQLEDLKRGQAVIGSDVKHIRRVLDQRKSRVDQVCASIHVPFSFPFAPMPPVSNEECRRLRSAFPWIGADDGPAHAR
jgi:hypothetical protein